MDVKVLIGALWDRIGGWALVAVGVLALFLGWLGVSDTPLPAEQIPYVVSGGMVGIALIGVGATLLITADLRDEWRKLEDLEQAVREAGYVRHDDSTNGTPDGAAEPTPERVDVFAADGSPSEVRRRAPLKAARS